MLGEMWRSLLGYLEKQPYWSRLQPILLLLFLYAGTAVVVRQYVEWQYGLSPSPPEFLRSYLFKQVSIVFLALAAALVVMRIGGATASAVPPPGGWRQRLAQGGRRWLWRAAGLILIALVALELWLRVTPAGTVGDVRIKLDPPQRVLDNIGFDPYGFVYLIYELNRQQRAWHFEVDLDPFDASLVPARDAAGCADESLLALCLAQAYAATLGRDSGPLILITHRTFGSATGGDRYYYWLHASAVSVISATDWRRFKEPDIYDYLAYSTIVQSILIHLDAACGDFQERYQEGRVTSGDIFQFQPTPQLMQPAVLAAHLSRPMQQLLFNCFGPAYAADAERLLSLDWLHADRVQQNLRKIVKPTPAP